MVLLVCAFMVHFRQFPFLFPKSPFETRSGLVPQVPPYVPHHLMKVECLLHDMDPNFPCV